MWVEKMKDFLEALELMAWILIICLAFFGLVWLIYIGGYITEVPRW